MCKLMKQLTLKMAILERKPTQLLMSLYEDKVNSTTILISKMLNFINSPNLDHAAFVTR